MEKLKNEIDKYVGCLIEINEELQTSEEKKEKLQLLDEMKLCSKKIIEIIENDIKE